MINAVVMVPTPLPVERRSGMAMAYLFMREGFMNSYRLREEEVSFFPQDGQESLGDGRNHRNTSMSDPNILYPIAYSYPLLNNMKMDVRSQ